MKQGEDYEIMNNKEIFIPGDIYFQCALCGKCCRQWSLTIDPATYLLIKDSAFLQERQKKFPCVEIIQFDEDSNVGIIGKINQECALLENDLCLIHSELGARFKPLVCRQFPFIFTSTPAGIYVSASFHCPGVSSIKGKPLVCYKPEIEKLAGEISMKGVHGNMMRVSNAISTTWEGYLELERRLGEGLDNEDTLAGIWDVLNDLVSLLLEMNSASCDRISSTEIAEYRAVKGAASSIKEPFFYRAYLDFLVSILSILEMWKRSVELENVNIIGNGGILESDTFGKKLVIKPFREYIIKDSESQSRIEFKNYLKHIVHQRKCLLTFDSLLTGIFAFSLLPLVFSWYSNMCAIARGKNEPEMADFREALGIIDLYFYHFKHLNVLFEKFASKII